MQWLRDHERENTFVVQLLINTKRVGLVLQFDKCICTEEAGETGLSDVQILEHGEWKKIGRYIVLHCSENWAILDVPERGMESGEIKLKGFWVEENINNHGKRH